MSKSTTIKVKSGGGSGYASGETVTFATPSVTFPSNSIASISFVVRLYPDDNTGDDDVDRGGKTNTYFWVGTDCTKGNMRFGSVEYSSSAKTVTVTKNLTAEQFQTFVSSGYKISIMCDSSGQGLKYQYRDKTAVVADSVMTITWHQTSISVTNGAISNATSGVIFGCSYTFKWSHDGDGSQEVTSLQFLYKDSANSNWETPINVGTLTAKSYAFDTGLIGASNSGKMDWKIRYKIKDGTATYFESSPTSATVINAVNTTASECSYGTTKKITWSIDRKDSGYGLTTKSFFRYANNTSFTNAVVTQLTELKTRSINVDTTTLAGSSTLYWQFGFGEKSSTCNWGTRQSITFKGATVGSPASGTSVVRGAVYPITWSYTDALNSGVTQVLHYGNTTACSNGSVNLTSAVRSYSLNTAVIPGYNSQSTARMYWYVEVSGAAASAKMAVANYGFANPSCSVTATAPSRGTTLLYGLKTRFAWKDFSAAVPSGASSISVSPASYTIKVYRSSDKTNPYATFTGSSKDAAVTTGYFDTTEFAVDNYVWTLSITTNVGSVVTTAEQDMVVSQEKPSLPNNTFVRGDTYKLVLPNSITDSTKKSTAQSATVTGIDIEVINASTNARLLYLGIAKTDTVYPWNTANKAYKDVTSVKWRAIFKTDIGTYTTALSDAASLESHRNLQYTGQYPTSNSEVYKGFGYKFQLSLVKPQPATGASSCNIAIDSAVFKYRVSGTTDIKTAVAVVNGLQIYQTIILDNASQYEWWADITLNTGDVLSNQGTANVTAGQIDITIANAKPADGTIAPRKISNTFSWQFVAATEGLTIPTAITQKTATLYWKSIDAANFNVINLGANANSYTFAANDAFKNLERIVWYVECEANTGTTARTEQMTVQVLDDTSNAVGTLPAGEFKDNSDVGITFEWQHNISTGTNPTGFKIRYSYNSGTSWTELVDEKNTTAVVFTAPVNKFVNGTVYWQIATYNSDGVVGNWSESTIFAVSQKPTLPQITEIVATPLPSIRWSSTEQVSYEVEIDGISNGQRYGYNREWKAENILEDGKHSVRIRVWSKMGLVSDWATADFTVLNVPSGEITINAQERTGQVDVVFDTVSGVFTKYYLLRDGMPVAKFEVGNGAPFVDRQSVGAHRYVVRGFDANGYYTDSAAITAAPVVDVAEIGLLDSGEWINLKWQKQNYSKSNSTSSEMVQYWGYNKPIYKATDAHTIVHNITGAKLGYERVEDVEAMQGQTVIYKDSQGHLAIGVFSSLSVAYIGLDLHSFALQITETQQNEVNYG